MATINLGKVITDEQKAVLDKQSYDSVNSKLVITGDENVDGNFTADSIIENMEGYEFILREEGYDTNLTVNPIYCGISKNGNKLTIVLFTEFIRTGELTQDYTNYAFRFNIPIKLLPSLYPYEISGLNNVLNNTTIKLFKTYLTYLEKPALLLKDTGSIVLNLYQLGELELNTSYLMRYEATLLLSDNLAV